MYRILALFTLLTSLLLVGCTTTLSTAADSWIGAPIDEFVARGGVPKRSLTFQDGRVAYTWDLGCEITMITRDGVIEKWSSTNCASIHPIPSSWKR